MTSYILPFGTGPPFLELVFCSVARHNDSRAGSRAVGTGRACLLNGDEVLRVEGDRALPGRMELELRSGVNHFVAKITHNRHSYGFSFALAGLHPAPRRPGTHEEPWRPFQRRGAGDLPYYCEADPSRRKPVVELTVDACLRELAEMTGQRPADVPNMLGADPNQVGWATRVRDSYVAAYRYREALVRLRDFRFVPAPMPGIESAARDSQGRIVTPMEKALEGHLLSPDAARYAERVESLRREVEPLLERLVDSRRPEFAAVLRLDEAFDAMWEDEIRNLPPILFLERPQYHYDALMFTASGQTPSYIRVFDPANRDVRDIFHAATLRAHDINLSWDAKTIFIGGGGVVAEIGVDGEGYQTITSGQSPAELPDGRLVFFDDAPGISACKAQGARQLLLVGSYENLVLPTMPDTGFAMELADFNGVMLQYFHWYLPPDGTLWNQVAARAAELAAGGFTAIWLPPAYKGAGGPQDVGYAVYDLYDLGEFDQRGTVRTKYGTKQEYLQAIHALHSAGLQVYADTVLNQRVGADAAEIVRATPFSQDNRLQPAGATREIEAYTHFHFPGRQGKYSSFQWRARHFDAVDCDARRPDERNTVYLFEGKQFDDEVALEKGNYSYLMGADLDFQDPQVRDEVTAWGKWYLDTTGIDGFRLDAVKHISAWFFAPWQC